jgi:hypothetical protein
LSSDDLIKVCRALDKERVDYRVDEQRRVEIAADQFDQAQMLVAKLDLGQHSIDEIRNESSQSSIWDSPRDRDRKTEIARDKILERLIGELDGVVSCLVSIHHPRASTWMRTRPKPSAFVYVETEGKRRLPHQTVQSIPVILAGREPDLTPGSITLMDRNGNKYLDPGDPGLGDSSRNRAREEALTEEITDKLDWIKGVRVQVKVLGPSIAETDQARTVPASRALGAPDHPTASGSSNVSSQHAADGSSPKIVVNKPATLEPESKSGLNSRSSGDLAPAADNGGQLAGPLAVRVDDRRHQSGRVVVRVPRGFYYSVATKTGDREPARDDLRLIADRTERQIRTAISLVIPESEAWKVEVDTFPDDVSLSRSVVLPSPAVPHLRVWDWGMVGAVGAAVSIVVAVGSWLQVARRPAGLSEASRHDGRQRVDAASTAGPAERVRELIRCNPEAAVSVLQRWAGQGGGLT